MAKKITLTDIAKIIDTHGKDIRAFTDLVEKGFAAVATDIADIKRDMATKEQVVALHAQVTSIEAQLRETKIELRLGNLEDKVFGDPRR